MIALPPAELLANAEPEAVLRWTYERFAKVAIVASFQAESSVIIDIASRIRPDLRVLTLDTGRLPQQTHDMIDRVRERYGIEVEEHRVVPHAVASRCFQCNPRSLSPSVSHHQRPALSSSLQVVARVHGAHQLDV